MSKAHIDNLPENKRRKVLDALLRGESLRKVAKMAGVSHTVVSDYKRKVMIPALKTAQQFKENQPLPETRGQHLAETANLTRDIVKASPFMERHEFLWGKVTQGIEKAENAVRVVTDRETGQLMSVGPDVGVLAPLLNQAHKNLELLGQVTGELQQAPQAQTNIMIVVPASSNYAAGREAEPVTIDIGHTR